MLQLHNAVCLDGRMIGVAGTGVATYAEGLRALLPSITTRPMLLTAGERPRSSLRRFAAALRLGQRVAGCVQERRATGETQLIAPDVFREAHVHFSLYRRLLVVRGLPADTIMHWTYPVPLRMAGCRNVYTIHDAIPLTHPELTPISARRHRRVLCAIAASADRIVTVSDTARREIVAELGCAPALVENVGQAVSPPASAASAPPPNLRSGSYVLVCGLVEPRKNLERILLAHRVSGLGLPLVVAGPDGWHAPPIVASPDVVRLHWQPRAEIEQLIAHARMLLMPSLAEGFGLPVIEAMARGTPVVTSRDGALAETAGGAALLVDPCDVSDIAAAIVRVHEDEALRRELIRAGYRRAADFAPAVLAGRLRRLYADLVASNAAIPYPAPPPASSTA